MLLELQVEQLTAELADVRRRLKGHPDSRLDGENGLAAATMRRVEQLEECCRSSMTIVLEIKLPVGVQELAAIVDGLVGLHLGKTLLMRQEGPMLQIYYEDGDCLPAPTGGE